MIKHTKEEMINMPNKQLAALDITSPEEEKLIEDIMLSRRSVSQPIVKFNQRLVPDIKTPEQEKEWQDKINEFNIKHSPIEAQIKEASMVLETIKDEIKTEEVSVVVPNDTTTKQVDTQVDTQVQIIDALPTPFCNSCDSKGGRHKKVCPKNPQNPININTNGDISTDTVQ